MILGNRGNRHESVAICYLTIAGNRNLTQTGLKIALMQRISIRQDGATDLPLWKTSGTT
jgi:hypothetical protein